MLIFPPKFTAIQLKQLARLCGESRSGTKPDISNRIVDALNKFKPLAPRTRVLSIDLGIRNLAYTLLEVPKSSQAATAKSRKRQDATSVVPILHAWERLGLIPEPSVKGRGKRKGKTGKVSAAPDTDQEADPTNTPVPIEDFSPVRLSGLAVDLILTRLLPLKPDLVIIEQQRFRSMGGSSVLEWTLRVNSLESMLYAAFTALQKLGRWPHGRLEGVAARKVLEFMALQEGEGASIWTKDAPGDNKRMKKDIVGRMLRDTMSGTNLRGVSVGEDEGLADVVREYVDRWSKYGKRGRSSPATGSREGLKKLDDLADCLLQGIAFIRWQENKRLLLEGGVEALEDQMVDEEALKDQMVDEEA
ncbi:hypothetical protein N0V82_001085 [Gnomoniopsis sp. IMI 355080]|nr:hypothetical protein N0V82_001085 [Gnomoniopsis sp. IMI 355080]